MREFFCRLSDEVYGMIGLGHIEAHPNVNRTATGGNLRLVRFG